MKVLLSILSLSALCVSMVFAKDARGDLKVGDVAPDFNLPGSDGKTYKLSDLKGQAVVVAWYPKAFTGGWTKECESLRESAEALQEFNVVYFTASCDDAETNKKFAKSLDLNYPILSDPSRATAKAYGLVTSEKGFPARKTFIIGEDGKILYIDSAVKTGSHGADIAAQLKELGVAKK